MENNSLKNEQVNKERISRDHPSVVLYLWLRRCHDLITAQTDSNLANLGVSQAQYHVLRIIDDCGPVSMTEISRMLFRGKSNLTTLIDRMEKAELVERISDGEDRRVIKIGMTKAGKKIHDEVSREHRAFLLELLKGLEQDEVNQLVNLLEKLGQVLGHEDPIFPNL